MSQWLGDHCESVINALQKELLIRSCPCPEQHTVLWGITTKGQRYIAMHLQQAVVSRSMRPSFQYPVTTVFHKLAVQVLLVAAVQRGAILIASAQGTGAYSCAIPDAVMQYGQRRYAIEYERVLKARSRYPEILSHRLQAIKRGTYDQVIWVVPDVERCARLQSWLYAIDWVPVASSWVEIRPEVHHRCIACMTSATWPAFLQEICV